MDFLASLVVHVVLALLAGGFGSFASVRAVRRVWGGLDRHRAIWFRDGLAAAARELDIVFAPRVPTTRTAVGRRDPYQVRVEIRSEQIEESGATRTVDYLCASLSGGLIPSSLGFAEERRSGNDLLIGDPQFDDAVRIDGEPAVLFALLSETVRRKLRRLIAYGGALRGGELSWHAETSLLASEIPEALRSLFDIAQELSSSDHGGLCARLVRNAREDSAPGVRLSNLLVLQDRFAHTADAVAASRACLHDASAWVRLAAARFLRGEVSTLEGLIEDPECPEVAATEAVSLLAARRNADESGAFLMRVVQERRGETGRQAIAELGRIKYRPALELLLALVERNDIRTATVAAEALGALGAPEAERTLLKAVVTADRELRNAAARALGSVGSPKVVERLLALLESRRLDAESRQAIRDAISAIQRRQVGAEAGQLSLAAESHEAGRLSLASPSPETGELSLVETDLK
jgi:hypothetical protein